MFVVTNRRVHEGRRGFDLLGKTPSEKGPHELRVLEATKRGRTWSLRLFDDRLTTAQKQEVALPASKTAWASQYVARRLLKRLTGSRRRHIVFFVHGFNNDLEAVLERARGFERRYGVEVIAFSWPANGGGVGGVVSYRSDKRDARASVGAVYRTMAKMRGFLDEFNAERLARITKLAHQKHPDDHERQNELMTRMAEAECPVRVTLLCHSMGNYLFKQIQRSSVFDEHHMLFDNVLLVAADTNNAGHAQWVDAIRCRRRVYVLINEDDSALRVSRIKMGEEQQARLGHYRHDLTAHQALYVDVTEAPRVGSSHAYFEGDPVRRTDARLFKFFRAALRGERAERFLRYQAASHTWRP